MKYIVILLTLFLQNAFGAPVSLGSFFCENNADKFDPNFQIEFNIRYAGLASCRTDSRTYFLNFQSPIPVNSTTFSISFYQENNGNSVTIRGRLANNQTVLLNRVSSQRVTGVDGRNWFLLTYQYNGGLLGLSNMTRLEWTFGGTIRIDNISAFYDNPLNNVRYLKMKLGSENIAINFNLEDIFNEIQKVSLFEMEWRIPRLQYGEVVVFDSGNINPDVYVECASVTLLGVTTSLIDSLGSSYTVECLNPDLVVDQRGLFLIRNTGTTPTFPGEFRIELRTIPRITENTRSASFNYPLLLKTILYP